MTTADREMETIDERLSELEKEKQSLLERKRRLLARDHVPVWITHPREVPRSTQEKVGLFSALFRGREDIYAVRWENQQGRQGYALACDNE